MKITLAAQACSTWQGTTQHGVTSVRPGHEAVPDAYSTLVPDAPRSCAVAQEGLKGTYSPEAEAGATA